MNPKEMNPQELFEYNATFFAREYIAAHRKGYVGNPKSKKNQKTTKPEHESQDWAGNFAQIAQVVLNSVPKKEPK